MKDLHSSSVWTQQPRPPKCGRTTSISGNLSFALPADGMFAVWADFVQLLLSRSLRFRVWVNLVVRLFFFSSPYLFIHSFQYTKHFIASMETSVAADLKEDND